MTQEISAEYYIVAYGYSQTFRLTAAEAAALIAAKEQGKQVVRFRDRVLSTSFTWIMPAHVVDSDRLDEAELQIAEKIGEWLARPAQELDFTPALALKYAKRLVKRIGSGEAGRLLAFHGNGMYPSAKRFLIAAKEKEGDAEPAGRARPPMLTAGDSE